ncbi:hypothetical protein SAMN04488069_110100 [Hymenobacter psychrophilus]|uniref:Uncharacterized protein n=1 Tax=Hymenobacter psychrophilus TaxID=651662 RepID=A0A1H3L559_9BACT|nr:hypothetical protein SAMN04488069_110100 [Hymenobacter psychrophilus]
MTHALACGRSRCGSKKYSDGLVVAVIHGNLFLYEQELAPFRSLRMVADASLSLSLSASV